MDLNHGVAFSGVTWKFMQENIVIAGMLIL